MSRRNSSNGQDEKDAMEAAMNGVNRQIKSRSSSPVKRTASEMDDESGTKNYQMDLDGASTSTTLSANDPSIKIEDYSKREGGGMTSTQPIPSIEEQVNLVYADAQKPAESDNQIGYLVSQAWLERVLARSSRHAEFNLHKTEEGAGEIGPIDNSDLLPKDVSLDSSLTDVNGDRFIPLRPGLTLGEHFQVFNEHAWAKISSWYGLAPGQLPIVRYAHNTTPDSDLETLQWEINPPIFTVRKMHNDEAGVTSQLLQDRQATAPQIVASRSERFQPFLKRLKSLANIPLHTKCRLWRVLATEQVQAAKTMPSMDTSQILSPPISREPSPQRIPLPKLVIDGHEFLMMGEGSQREMIDIKDETFNEKYNGKVDLNTVGLAADQILIVEEQTSSTDVEEFVSDVARKKAIASGLTLPKNGLASAATSGRNSPAPGVMTRGRLRAQGRAKGTVGLTNLGNTCYMNSALQCIRSVEELTLYFLQQNWSEELNTKNPLGHGGNIAKAYAGLINSIYGEGNISSFAPRVFKQTLGKYGTQFSGYGQQDSQEFISFLVDGLHEDLNRIVKKPYTENPDSDDKTVHDPEAIKALGETYRQNHRARNDSVAMDLFNGFYKNTMVCPTCDKVSITFDPFSLLTLQLPIESTWQHNVTFVPLSGRPVIVDVDIDKQGTVRTLKEFIAKRVPGLDADRLMVAEIYSHKFYKTFEDKTGIVESGIASNDDIAVYELEDVPTNFPPPRRNKKVRSMLSFGPDSEDDIAGEEVKYDERMLVPVFHRSTQESKFSTSKSLCLWPTFIILRRAEAKNLDEIKRKVLQSVATMTTRDILTEAQNDQDMFSDPADGEGDVVVTTEEDATSPADPSVQAESVGSEDEMVDITVTANGTDSTGQAAASHEQRPRSKSGGAIPRMLSGLFDLKIVPGGSEMVMTGWSGVDAGKNYPSISSRIATKEKEETPESTTTARSTPDGTPAGSEEDEDSAEFSNPAKSIELQRETSAELDFISSKPGGRRNNKTYARKNRGKPAKQYGKGNKTRGVTGILPRIVRGGSSSPETSGADGNDALIRLKEAILVDWDTPSFNALFRADNEEDGAETKKLAQVLPNPELDAKRSKRQARKRSGVALDDCFTETAKGETLTEDNAWYCGRCKELRMANKKLEIWTAPDILVIHLKRFSAARQFRDKLDVVVDFPIEGLDLNDKVGLTEGKDLTYDLIAVDNHYGGLGGGHYTAYAKNFVDSNWYEYNDSQVSRVKDPNVVITSAAYLLVYRRRSPTGFLGPPYLQDLAESFYSGSAEDQTSDLSTSQTLNGSSDPKGLRLGGLSSRNGHGTSSSALVGEAGAVALLGGGASAAAGSAAQRSRTRLREVDDEGYGDDADDEGENSVRTYGPSLPQQDLGWTWASVDDTQMNDGDGDADSTVAADGDDEHAGSLNGRMAEDFGDDIYPTGAPSPAGQHFMSDDYNGSPYGNGTQLQVRQVFSDDDDGDVTEIRVNGSDDEATRGL